MPRNIQSHSLRQHLQRGFTLLEVLIALLVLSIGLLGLAGLQSIGLRSTHGASLTSQASMLAYDMADRIRANPDAGATYAGFVTDCPDPVPTTPLEDADLGEWSCSIETLLPGGVGRIARVVNGAVERYTITIEWLDTQTADPDDPWTFVLNIEI